MNLLPYSTFINGKSDSRAKDVGVPNELTPARGEDSIKKVKKIKLSASKEFIEKINSKKKGFLVDYETVTKLINKIKTNLLEGGMIYIAFNEDKINRSVLLLDSETYEIKFIAFRNPMLKSSYFKELYTVKDKIEKVKKKLDLDRKVSIENGSASINNARDLYKIGIKDLKNIQENYKKLMKIV